MILKPGLNQSKKKKRIQGFDNAAILVTANQKRNQKKNEKDEDQYQNDEHGGGEDAIQDQDIPIDGPQGGFDMIMFEDMI